MKRLSFAIFASLLSITLFLFSLSLGKGASDISLNTAEALAPSEEGDSSGSGGGTVIKCKCTKAIILGNDKCLASNNGNICAQSSPGGNISCNTYNSNCGEE